MIEILTCFILFSVGVIGMVTGESMQRLIGLSIFLASPNLLMVHSGASALFPVTIVVETVLIIGLVILHGLRKRERRGVESD